MTTHKLLLADDSATIRKVVELTFADEGVEVFAVGDGDAAMLKFVEVQPDIVLVDVEMPGPTGYQICEMIKQDAATSHIPVLLLVGSFEPFDQTEAERVGADGFLTKPFHSIRELVARVSDLLGMGDPTVAAGPETEDIEELYSSSFAETMPIQDYDTEEDLILDSGVDDRVTEAASLVESSDKKELDAFQDSVLDDQMIEAIRPNGSVDESRNVELGPADDTPVPVKDFDWSPAAKVVDEPVSDQEKAAFEPRFVFADAETIEGNYIPGPLDYSAPGAEETAEPSEELVSLVAKRVVERLSDRVIREIAQDAVPRIAEKLIREALAEENNT